MARKLNLSRLKDKVAELNGEKKNNRKSIFWTPQLPKGESSHEYQVYLLPFPDQEDYPFKERWFYYALGNMKDADGNSMKDKDGRYIKAPLTLKQFGEKDPVQDLINQLWNKEGKSDDEARQDQEDCKKLFPTQTAYIPVIVKGEESLGVRLWKFTSKMVYERLIELFVKHEKFGVLNDPENARWLTVKVVEVQGKRPPMNKKVGSIDPEFSNEPLSEDSEQIQKWVDSIPDLDDALKYQKHDFEGLKDLLIMWTESIAPDEEKMESEGTEAAKSRSKKKAPKKKGRKEKKNEEPMSKEEALKELDDFMNDDDDEEDDDE